GEAGPPLPGEGIGLGGGRRQGRVQQMSGHEIERRRTLDLAECLPPCPLWRVGYHDGQGLVIPQRLAQGYFTTHGSPQQHRNDQWNEESLFETIVRHNFLTFANIRSAALRICPGSSASEKPEPSCGMTSQ